MRSFVTVVEAGSVTKAAGRLFRSQQAISYQLAKLEEELGLVLFQRHGPRLRLTREGRRLYEQARESLAHLESTVHELQEANARLEGTLRIGAWLEQAATTLPALLSAFVAEFPGTSFELSLGTDAELEAKLLADEIDAGFFVFVRDGARVETRPAFRRRLVLTGSSDYLAGVGRLRSVRDTLALEILDYSDSHAAYVAWVRRNAPGLVGQARRTQPRVVVDNDLVLKALVLQGLGVAVLPEEIVLDEVASGRLRRVLPRKTEAIEATIDLGVKRKRTSNALLSAFTDFAGRSAPEALR